MELEFTYQDYDIVANCKYDNREDGCYLGDIDFEVYNSQGEDVTQDICNLTTISIHNKVIEVAQQERDLTRGASNGI